MEIVKEYLDEKTNEYVLEFNATEEEKEALGQSKTLTEFLNSVSTR